MCALAGIAAAAAVYFRYPPVYESQAKLLVRYVLERSAVDPIESTRGSGQATDSVLNSEVEILTSWDLALQVADTIGVKRLLPGSAGTPTKEAAASTIASGLEVTIHRGTNIIFVSYKNRDPELATLVLTDLVNRYFTKHLEVHRSAGAFDFVTQQTDQVRARLTQTEDALRTLKGKAGILSLTDSTAALSNDAARTEEQLHMAESELAEQQARVLQLGGVVPEPSPTSAGSPSVDIDLARTNGTPSELVASTLAGDRSAADENRAAPGGRASKYAGPKNAKSDKAGSSALEIPAEIVQQYQVLVSRLPQLRQAKLELLSKYTPQNELVRANQAEIDDAENQRRDLEKKFPNLPSKVGPIGSSNNAVSDLASETARLAGITAKREALASGLREAQERIKQLSQITPQILDLERQKELEETNYKYFQGTLEKARIDEALDPSKMPNISAVQRPSAPIMMTDKRNKIAKWLAGGGLVLGVMLALLNELVLNRTVRRPIELEKLIGVSPLISIPYGANGRSRSQRSTTSALARKNAKHNNLAPWDGGHPTRPYCDAIRDRLNLYFELNQLEHKPKLVGVTGFSEAAGTSTLAAGLAAALSETGDGKVLLVDANLGPQDVHPFFKGRPAYALKTALQPASAITSAADNLYLATVERPNAGPAQLGLKKFFDLIPNLKASDFDYIIFDMPVVGQTSPTIGMAPFMDKLLLVVEAGKDNRDVIKRAHAALVAGRNNVSVILNKTRSYAPKWVDGDL